MYEFHYDYILSPRIGNFFSTNLVYLDTDAFIYKFTSLSSGENKDDDHPTIYDIIRRDCHEYFDTSDYDPQNEYGVPLVNKKRLGYMKDELSGHPMTHFIGLRSKLYMFKTQSQKIVKKCKGITSSGVKHLTFTDYYDALFKNEQTYTTFNSIQSRKHILYTESVTKLALDSSDDKRYICPDKINTLAWFNYNIFSKPSTSR